MIKKIVEENVLVGELLIEQEKIYPGDTFGMMSGSLSLERKLLCAIENDMLSVFKELIEGPNGPDLVNSILMKSSRRTTLHVCANKHKKEMIKILLKLGADPLKQDGFGHSSLELALGQFDIDCLWLILEVIPSDRLYLCLNKKMSLSNFAFKVLMGCTTAPCMFFWLSSDYMCIDFHCLFCIIYNYYPCRNPTFTLEDVQEQLFKRWYRNWMCQVKTLKHLSRCAIRKASHFNVCNFAGQLPLPESLKRYLIDFSDCID
ncbi:hypothetical protein HELRODRAFT_175695 [Helobdella robusta]|uniref:SOCS box domain-containing protein n=1 Tax=Helobdella robusta TaxID=6412 RepID=T1F9J3_HELRO|nr:hypothetical protein HELRODRAFT_175695 [Helobdella robusta]ESO00706.1 hypothetical protein HELRODRAFT_175695 [Helobdella robusta]